MLSRAELVDVGFLVELIRAPLRADSALDIFSWLGTLDSAGFVYRERRGGMSGEIIEPFLSVVELAS